MASAFLAWGGRYAAGFCVGGFTEVAFAEACKDFGPCPEDNLTLQLLIIPFIHFHKNSESENVNKF